MKEFTITKRISKQGPNSILVIPKILSDELEPRDMVEVKIKLIKKHEAQ